jgi:hypothetical protein
MGKNRERADALFNAFEKELTTIAQERGRYVRLGKKWRLQAIEFAKQRELTVQQIIDELRPNYIEAVRQANLINPLVLHPNGERVPFVLFGPKNQTMH